jgi:endoglucanase
MIKSKIKVGFCRGRNMKGLQTRSVKVVIVCMLLYSITPLYAAAPWLHVDGNKIKDPRGNVVVLRGISLIDLGFLDDWEGGAIEMIDRLTDKNDSQGNSPGWYPKIIRIPIAPYDAYPDYPSKWTPAGDEEYYNTHLRPLVDYCALKGLYVIIDWHYVANTYDHVATTSDFWTHMAPRFANDSHVMFELFNEPVNDINDDWIGNADVDWLSVRDDMQTWYDIVRSYAPNNLILVAGAFYSQIIGPAATYPLTGDNIVMVSHIYPGHWCDDYGWWYQDQITTCAAVHPVMMTEWGFTSDPNYDDEYHLLIGTIANYGQPLMDFIEGLEISNTAWVASYDWGPPMFYRPPGWPPPPGTWDLRIGEGEMGGFVKDTLYARRNDDQPSWLYGDLTHDNKVDINDLSEFCEVWWLEDDCNETADLDLKGDCIINLYEFSLFALDWLEGVE